MVSLPGDWKNPVDLTWSPVLVRVVCMSMATHGQYVHGPAFCSGEKVEKSAVVAVQSVDESAVIVPSDT